MGRFVRGLLGFGMVLFAAGALAVAEELKLYPGSVRDEKASREASQAAPGKVSQVYTTSEGFEKVCAFYKSLYPQETRMRATGPTLPNGQQVRWAFFLIDRGRDLATSKYWIKVQRPFVGGADEKDVRDITVIQSVRTTK